MTPENKLHLLIADDHAMILEMFQMFVGQTADMELSTAQDFDGAFALIGAQGPFDIILLDLQMPGMNGLEGLDRALAANGGKPVAILTGNPTAHLVDEVLGRGGAGVVPKTMPLKSLANAIRFMAAGERYVPLELLNDRNTARDSLEHPLTDREFGVLEHLAEGRSNRDIATALNLAEQTVKMHVKSICRKLGVSNRTQAVIASRDRNLL
ncbi:response regulator transcription factor [Sinirhodobacter huangdaonensis]|uniref:Response regulator transcription factor n=1 Tax=Paenirhodobacter huangdaonensis TaxID=2501515 RepID=A0A3S3MR58_9RHOB|nr:response regulator transcription factor [Sinirhodobacter huangdaonensis]RWR53371.1 response regulator transcription factor [Sinirhodobacter huangdaonensis]